MNLVRKGCWFHCLTEVLFADEHLSERLCHPILCPLSILTRQCCWFHRSLHRVNPLVSFPGRYSTAHLIRFAHGSLFPSKAHRCALIIAFTRLSDRLPLICQKATHKSIDTWFWKGLNWSRDWILRFMVLMAVQLVRQIKFFDLQICWHFYFWKERRFCRLELLRNSLAWECLGSRILWWCCSCHRLLSGGRVLICWHSR